MFAHTQPFPPSPVKTCRRHFKTSPSSSGLPGAGGGRVKARARHFPATASSEQMSAGWMLPLEHSYPCADRSSKDTHGNNCQAGKKHGGTETNWAPCLQLAHSVLARQHLKGCARHLPASRAHTPPLQK